MEPATSTGETKLNIAEVVTGDLPVQISDSIIERVSDHELIAATCKGDEAAFEEIVTRYRNQITNFLYRMLGDYEDAVDLAQETFVRVYKARERYTDAYAFSTYIYRIATNLAISELRKRKRRRLVSLSGFFSNDEGDLIEFQPPDKQPLPDATLADQQMTAVISKAIITLPEKYRAPLILRDIEGKSYDEISTILATNEGTIKSRISRGRNMLREKLKSYF
jgi:RNA polymerase sigma-70 factor (ECF subfamily)